MSEYDKQVDKARTYTTMEEQPVPGVLGKMGFKHHTAKQPGVVPPNRPVPFNRPYSALLGLFGKQTMGAYLSADDESDYAGFGGVGPNVDLSETDYGREMDATIGTPQAWGGDIDVSTEGPGSGDRGGGPDGGLGGGVGGEGDEGSVDAGGDGDVDAGESEGEGEGEFGGPDPPGIGEPGEGEGEGEGEGGCILFGYFYPGDRKKKRYVAVFCGRHMSYQELDGYYKWGMWWIERCNRHPWLKPYAEFLTTRGFYKYIMYRLGRGKRSLFGEIMGHFWMKAFKRAGRSGVQPKDILHQACIGTKIGE
jgi:hypothetical protein